MGQKPRGRSAGGRRLGTVDGKSRLLFVLALGLATALLLVLALTEPVPARFWFSLAVTVAVGAALAAALGRLFLATFLTFCFVGFVLVVSFEKKRLMNMALHSYDVAFYLNRETLSFLWEGYPLYIATTLAALAAINVLAISAWHIDTSRCSRAVAGIVSAIAILAAVILVPKQGVNAGGFQMLSDESSLVSSFFLSFGETLRALDRGQLLKAGTSTDLPKFTPLKTCEPVAKPPNILLIHQESLFPPSLFPSLDYDRALDAFFLSADGKLHKLGVETWGGASWITEFALLSGISTKDFGGMRPFVQVFMQGRLEETLPQTLNSCGYESVLLFPMQMGFVSLDRFYRSIGFSRIVDKKAQGAASAQERDRFYFENALEVMDAHFKSSDRPLFLYVQTMAAHGPYDKALWPDANVPGGALGAPAQLNEYLRRVAMAKLDGEYLIDEIERRFPEQPILVVRYGDHQPTVTKSLLAQARAEQKAGTLKGLSPDGLVTFYAMAGNDFAVLPLPEYDVLDVAYLGTLILEAAGLPLSEAQQERKRLMANCNGRYAACDARLGFNRRLIDSGLVRLP